MFAGKTTELQRRIRLARDAGRRVLAAKPARDTRYADHELVTHTGVRVAARAIGALDELSTDPSATDFDFIAIDEIHFFASEAVAPITALRARGVSIAVAGCDIDHFGEIFAPFDALLPIATEVARIHGTCARCGAPSTHTQRLIPASDRIVAGGEESYEPRCASCFEPTRSDRRDSGRGLPS